ncbi:MAG: arylsulfatase [Bacteroidales bacterium]
MKKTNLAFASGAMLLAATGCNENKLPEKPMNVIYILADDLGYGDIGCYGQEVIKTPNIDKMAAEGMRFTQHYAGCTVSAPSRGSLMTGQHTGHTRIRGNMEIKPEGQFPMEDNTFTIAKLMKQAGYTTGLFGKWGIGHPTSESTPPKMGFDDFYGYNCQRMAHSYYPPHLWHVDEKVILEGNLEGKREDYSQDLVHEHAINFIRENKDKPFFGMFTYTLPHAELSLPHDSIYAMYENMFDETPHNGFDGYRAVEKPRATFAAMVTRLDWYVGEIFKELKAQGLDKNTMVIFTSDNGPHREGGANPDFFKSYGPLKGSKRDVYEGGIRVPMIAWAPEMIKGGIENDHISAFWDVMPTFAELTGQKLDTATDGISFLPTLFSWKGQQQHEYLYWEFHELRGRQAIRKGNWKAMRQNISSAEGASFELYDLSKDLHEDNNVAAEYPEIAEELNKMMDEVRVPSEYFNFGFKKQ